MKINYWHDFEEEQYYHIYNHAVSNQNLFETRLDYEEFLAKHHKYLSCFFDTVAYCLMPNHYHFVVKVKPLLTILKNTKKEKSNASTFFQNNKIDINTFVLDQYRRFFSSYSLAFNFRHNRQGQLFLKKFKRVSLSLDHKLLNMICYLHHNPIHHEFTLDYSEWKYSSYLNYISDSPDESIKKLIEEEFGGINAFLSFHEEYKKERM